MKKRSKYKEKFNFSLLTPKKSILRNQLKKIITKKLLKNKKLNTNLQSKIFIKNNNLYEFFENISYYTKFLDSSVSIIERLHCVFYNIKKYPKCKFCGSPSKYFNNYFYNGFYSKFCSRSCNRKVNFPHDFMDKEELEKMHKEIGKKRKGMKFSKKWKEKLSQSAKSKITQEKNML